MFSWCLKYAEASEKLNGVREGSVSHLEMEMPSSVWAINMPFACGKNITLAELLPHLSTCDQLSASSSA